MREPCCFDKSPGLINLAMDVVVPHSLQTMAFPLPTLPLRPADGHKGTFGRISIIGGSVGMSGAVCLASVAALRSGSGLVTAVVPRAIQSIVAAFEPCIMTVGLIDNPEFGLLALSSADAAILTNGRDAVGIGPGLGENEAAATLVRDVLKCAACPLVLDADALNVAARHCLLTTDRNASSCVITPHPGEFARLTGRSIEDVEQHREEAAVEFAVTHRVIVVLKGPGTIVTDGTHLYRNTTGNSGMGTGGSGDVLTGILTSLLGQGLPALNAAAIAVHVHGLAGDIAAERFTQRGMIASDLLNCLPEAWRQLGA